MKAKVVIENGETDIVLTPENEFEVTVVKSMHKNQKNFNSQISALADYRCGSYENHRININIKEVR